jgi:hypothetical protein
MKEYPLDTVPSTDKIHGISVLALPDLSVSSITLLKIQVF